MSHSSREAYPSLDVILPAGGRIDGEFAKTTREEYKALIAWEGKTILRRTLETFEQLEGVGRRVVIGGERVRTEAQSHGAEGVLEEGASGPENIFRGLEWLQAQERPAARVLIATTDLPFLSAESIRAFVQACPQEADISIPIISANAFETQFPGTASAYVPLKSGSVTVGCVFMLSPEALLRARGHIETLFEARKSNLALARVVGMSTILRLLTKRLDVHHIEARCSRVLGVRGVGVRGAPPELAYDMDTLEDFLSVCRHKAEREETV
jgi:CTP:molybdopterin cytidylyltransferase MocA